MFQVRARLNFNKRIKDNYFHSAFLAPRIARLAAPGQFVNIRVNDSCQPLLRRPFSIYRVSGLNIEIIYEVIGKGTEILSQRKQGGYLDVIGPLGNGFSYQLSQPQAGPPSAEAVSYRPIIVAGGIGVAPLLFLAEKLRAYSLKPIAVLIGAETKKQVLCEKEFKKIGCDVRIATDDGSRGFKGKATDLLKRLLTTEDLRLTTIYACGPQPMLKEISCISQKYNLCAQVSLEAHLACGIGACLGCVVNTKNGYQRVCKEGPVFAAEEIVWEDTDE